VLLQGANPHPCWDAGNQPSHVRVVASDGVTAVNGATVGWTATNGVTLSACGGASTFRLSRMKAEWFLHGLRPQPQESRPSRQHSRPESTIPRNRSRHTIGDVVVFGHRVTTPYLWIASGATVSQPITARVVNTGVPQSGVTVNFRIAQEPGLSVRQTAVTNASGYASVTLTLTDFTANVQLTACVAPGNSPCQTVYGNAVAAALLNLQAWPEPGRS